MSAEQLKMLADQYAIAANITAPTVRTLVAAAARKELHAAIDALTRAPAQQGGEVVAWECTFAGADPGPFICHKGRTAEIAKREGATVRPLVYGDAVPVVKNSFTAEVPVQSVQPVDRDAIKSLALAHGFRLKEQPDGTMDLNPYVYEFAAALLAAPTPPAAEPVAWRELVAAAVNENAGYIDNYLGSYNSNRCRCTGCGIEVDGWGSGDYLNHEPNCPYIAQQAAIKRLRELIEHPPASPADAVDAGRYAERIFTYANQPGNVEAWRFGESAIRTSKKPGGDLIDTGLQLLLELQNKGYGIVAINQATAQAGGEHG